MKWNIKHSSFPLAPRCLVARPELALLSDQVAQYCSQELPSAWRDVSKQKNRTRRDNYFYRFLLPVAELAGWPQQSNMDLPRSLAAHLLWCFAWRSLDDVLDSPAATAQDLRQVLASFSNALTISICVSPPGRADIVAKMTEIYLRTCDIATKERLVGLRPEEAWKRAAPFFIIPALALRLRRSHIAYYRSYINVAALTHDIHDLFSDLRAGINSPPIRWLRDIDAEFPFRPQLVRAWFDRAAVELEKRLEHCRSLGSDEFLIMNIMLNEAQEVLDELRCQL